jgi:ferredoxin--NADP+ reductase
MSHRIAPSVAIVGSGPSGFYAVDGLSRALPGCRIDIIDRLRTPYGLVRFGVAPDHQGTKAVARQFERLALKPGIRFLGGIELGRDITLAALRTCYDAVVIATGAAQDRRLGIPGENLPGVFGSWPFVGWYNGHPDFAALDVRLPGTAAAVIGNGNVAIDLVRVLAKTPQEMQASDLCDHAAAVIHAAALTDIYMIGRRGPAEASFTAAELAELGHLARAVPVIEGAAVPASSGAADPAEARVKDRNLEIMRGFAGNVAGSKPITLHLLFNHRPVAIEGDGRVERLRVEPSAGGAARALAVGTVISAIGYRSAALDTLALDQGRGVIANRDGEIEPGLYVVGWARRGPSGVIATNRADSLAVADRAAGYLKTVAPVDRPLLDDLLAGRGLAASDFAAWQAIDRAEIEAGKAVGRPRRKQI